MKCVKLRNGEIIRVKDKEAEELVDKNEGYYVPKAAWKRRQGIGKGDGEGLKPNLTIYVKED